MKLIGLEIVGIIFLILHVQLMDVYGEMKHGEVIIQHGVIIYLEIVGLNIIKIHVILLLV